MAEPLSALPDPEVTQRLHAAAALTQRSTHYLRGQLHTILGFAELLQEEDAEREEEGYGALLTLVARRLQARIDALLYVMAMTGPTTQAPRPEALGGLVQELAISHGVPIDCRVPGHQPVAVDVQGLRCLLQEIAALRDPPSAITLAVPTAPERLEVTCREAVAPTGATPGSTPPSPEAEQPLGVTMIAAVATALGGTLTSNVSPAGGRDLRIVIPLPAPHPPTTGAAGG